MSQTQPVMVNQPAYMDQKESNKTHYIVLAIAGISCCVCVIAGAAFAVLASMSNTTEIAETTTTPEIAETTTPPETAETNTSANELDNSGGNSEV